VAQSGAGGQPKFQIGPHTSLNSSANGEKRSASMHWGTVNSSQAAAHHGTLHALGEYACNKCKTVHLIRLGGDCGVSRNGKTCTGQSSLVKNVSGEYVKALSYALNSGGSSNQCARNHIGLIGNKCKCCCSGTEVSAGSYIEGFDLYNYPLQSPPTTILAYTLISIEPLFVVYRYTPSFRLADACASVSKTLFK